MNESAPHPAAQDPSGLRILVVEDQMVLAMMLEDMLTDLGYRVVKAARVAKAVELAATAAIDGAILDMNVAGEPVYPVAQELHDRGIPFLFATGYGPEGLRPDYRGWPILAKPFRLADLRRVTAATFGARAV
jgi:CheY-like chemotaxis protein